MLLFQYTINTQILQQSHLSWELMQIVTFPTKDKSQMLVGVGGFFVHSKRGFIPTLPPVLYSYVHHFLLVKAVSRSLSFSFLSSSFSSTIHLNSLLIIQSVNRAHSPSYMFSVCTIQLSVCILLPAACSMWLIHSPKTSIKTPKNVL